jgi:2Fe-2S ferredoxin
MNMTKIIFVEADGSEKIVEAQNGLSLLEVAHKNGVDLEGACEGSLACSTCHLIIEKEFFENLPEPSEEEEDMLDLAWGLTHTSRLGCQIIVNDSLDGMKVKVPTGTRNMSV